MEIENIKTALLSSFEGNEVNELLKFSFNTALTYLIDKHNGNNLFGDTLSIEKLAIEVSASYFQENKDGELELEEEQRQILDNCETKGDYELIKQIHQKINSSLNQ